MHLMLKKELSRGETLAFGYLLYLNIVLQLVESVVPVSYTHLGGEKIGSKSIRIS